MKKVIVTQVLSYGTLEQWKWIRQFYGDDTIRSILSSIPVTSMRPNTRALISVLLDFNNWNYAPRSITR